MDFNTENINFDEKGLVPCVVQDAITKQVLMLAYMNRESIMKTIETKQTWFFSRSRQELWNKGATSGNVQALVSLSFDCDGDTLLAQVIQTGNACHTGSYTCFFNNIFGENTSQDVLNSVYSLIVDRKANPIAGSYTNYLLDKGIDKICKKVCEEASEVIIGAKNNDTEEIVYEVSDLIYHTLVLMVEMGVTIEDVKSELNSRYINKDAHKAKQQEKKNN